MSIAVAAVWKAKRGEEERIARVIRVMTPLSRAEQGCQFYQGHQSPEDPTVFFLYEQYADLGQYEAHKASPYFEQYVKGEAIPHMESREIAIYRVMEDC